MRTVEFSTATSSSKIHVGESFSNIRNYVNPDCTFVITDENVFNFHKEKFQGLKTIVIEPGEKNKTMDTVCGIYERLISMGADRTGFVLAVGGGIVSDVSGFAASTYFRGVRFGFVSTTLLSQVDASVGGKNGINFSGYKNMIGIIRQPEFVVCDIDMLSTLPDNEYVSGLGEIAKHGFIFDENMVEFMERNIEAIIGKERSVLEKLIYDSVVFKSGVVSRDEKEMGERRILNFGHTIGHGIEAITGMPHGMAVSVGMVAAGKLSVKEGLLKNEKYERMIRLLSRLGLPVSAEFEALKVKNAVMLDKKREQNNINFVLLEDFGRPIIKKIDVSRMEDVISDLY